MTYAEFTWNVLQNEAGSDPRTRVLAADEVEVILQRVRGTFVSTTNTIWWWTQIRPCIPTMNWHYGSRDPWPDLIRALPVHESWTLIVTDEKPTPWGCISGSLEGLEEVVAEAPRFEYMLVSDDFSAALLDTHHDQIIFLGDCFNDDTLRLLDDRP